MEHIFTCIYASSTKLKQQDVQILFSLLVEEQEGQMN
jgi:hypothetical protein